MAEKTESVSTMGRTLLIGAVLIVGVLTNEVMQRVSTYLAKSPVIGAVDASQRPATRKVLDAAHLAYLKVPDTGSHIGKAAQDEATLFAGSGATRTAIGAYSLRRFAREQPKTRDGAEIGDATDKPDLAKLLPQAIAVTSVASNGAFLNGQFVAIGRVINLNLSSIGRTPIRLEGIDPPRIELSAEGQRYTLQYHKPGSASAATPSRLPANRASNLQG